MKILAFLSDFGYRDPYVGVVKGVLLERLGHANLKIVDITHGIPFGDILYGSFALASSFSFFPNETVFLCVVDPGVGSERRGLLASGGGYTFVAPDNGLLTLTSRKLRNLSYRKIDCPSLYLRPLSNTFHARDVFAPVCAHILSGKAVEDVGPEISDPVMLEIPRVRVKEDRIMGEILFFDHFGNAITNIEKDTIDRLASDTCQGISVKVKDRWIQPGRTYSDVKKGEAVAIFGSSGYLEISTFEGSSIDLLGIQKGDRVVVVFESLQR